MAGIYEIIAKKRDGGVLTPQEISFFVKGVTDGSILDYQVSALLMAIFLRGLHKGEMVELTEAMLRSGETIDLSGIEGPKIDKHSTGGVGDKVSFIVAPWAAACGVKVPMLSGRSLGHTGGTLDKLESLPGTRVFLSSEEFKRTLSDAGLVICGQTDNLVPADRRLYALRDATATVNSLPLIVSSIMSKKLALGTDGIVLDVKTGSGAFLPELERSRALCEALVEVGHSSGRPTLGLITQMDQPLGSSVGNALEMVESVEALRGNFAQDLYEVCQAIAAAILVAGKRDSSFDQTKSLLDEALGSGRALERFRRMVELQGGNPRALDDLSLFPRSGESCVVKARQSGYIAAVDAFSVGMATIDLGAGRVRKEDGVDPGAGILLRRKVGEYVEAGEGWAELFASSRGRLEQAETRMVQSLRISPEPVKLSPRVLETVNSLGVRSWEKI